MESGTVMEVMTWLGPQRLGRSDMVETEQMTFARTEVLEWGRHGICMMSSEESLLAGI